MSTLLEAASSFLLLVPGFLPLFFFAHSRLIDSSSSVKPLPAISVFVFFLGPLAALSASLSLAALEFEKQGRSIRIAQNVLQSFVEFGYRLSILYILAPRSFVAIASRSSFSGKPIFCHNTLYASLIISTFALLVVEAALSPSVIPYYIPLSLGICSAIFPVPLIIHLAVSAGSARVHEIWAFTAVIQTLSAFAIALRVPQGPGYALSSSMLTVLWGGGIITLFYTLSSVPLPVPSPQPQRLAKVSFLSFSSSSTRGHVHYETPHSRQASRGLISEDFTALRDPFASPPPFPRSSSATPAARSSLAQTAPPHIFLTPPPAPIGKAHKPPRPRVREIKPHRRCVNKKPSAFSMKKRTSSQSLEPFSRERPHDEPCGINETGSQDTMYLSNEALLSQLLLHSLIQEASSLCPSPQPSSAGGDKEGSACSDSASVATIRTRRDENGRRYGSEEARQSNAGSLQEVKEGSMSNARRVDANEESMLSSTQDVAVASLEEESAQVEIEAAETEGVYTTWWEDP